MPPKKHQEGTAGGPALRPRKRRRTEVSREIDNRRLDALARLLQGASECVAFTVVSDQIWIAANELNDRSRENRYTKHIRTLMSYFGEEIPQGGQLTGDTRLDFLEKVFTPQCKKLGQTTPIPVTVITSIIKEVVEDKGKDLSLTVHRKHIEGAGLALASFKRFYQDFCKVETSAAAELTDFFKKDYLILTESKAKDVHAEMQLLEKLIQGESYLHGDEPELYFAISKLCCLHCHEMLTATNTVFSDKNIGKQIVSSGTHALSFPKWKPPAVFLPAMEPCSDSHSAGGSADTGSDEQSIATHIAKQGHENIQAMLEQKSPSGVYQKTSISSSEAFTATTASKLIQHRKQIESMREALKRLPFSDNRANMELLDLGWHIITTKTYQTLLEKGDPQTEDPKPFITEMTSELGLTLANLEQKIIQFLCLRGFLPDETAGSFTPLLTQQKAPLVSKAGLFAKKTPNNGGQAANRPTETKNRNR